jgi:hypothetical protein
MPLSPGQRASLTALADALCPAVVPPPTTQHADFWRTSAGSITLLISKLVRGLRLLRLLCLLRLLLLPFPRGARLSAAISTALSPHRILFVPSRKGHLPPPPP